MEHARRSTPILTFFSLHALFSGFGIWVSTTQTTTIITFINGSFRSAGTVNNATSAEHFVATCITAG